MGGAGLRVGIADHFGWAVAVTANASHEVVDRRRIELVEPGVAMAPIHHEGKPLDDAGAAALVAEVRASSARASSAALAALAADLPGPVDSLCLRVWPESFPTDIAVQRRAPWEARADAVMYRQILAESARARGWTIRGYEAKAVLGQAALAVGARIDDLLDAPRAALGPPWTKDHRIALAATIASRA